MTFFVISKSSIVNRKYNSKNKKGLPLVCLVYCKVGDDYLIDSAGLQKILQLFYIGVFILLPRESD